MRLQVLTAARVKKIVFLDNVPCNLVEKYRGACSFCHQGDDLPDYMSQHLRRQSYSCSREFVDCTPRKTLEGLKKLYLIINKLCAAIV
jgi:hypothetical protein